MAIPENRHYCHTCSRKRKESVMVRIGRAPFGKSMWACVNHYTLEQLSAFAGYPVDSLNKRIN